MNISNLVSFYAGTPQFRITESYDERVPIYNFYGQMDLAFDLISDTKTVIEHKQIRTSDKVSILQAGDILFSLISGQATKIGINKAGFLYTQNYVLLKPNTQLVPEYLVFLLNCDRNIKKQFELSLQGSSVMKYTLSQLKALQLPSLPAIEKQKLIGNIYFKQLRLQALKHHLAELETKVLLHYLTKGE